MKYILMMHAPLGTGAYQVGEWPPEDFGAHIAFRSWRAHHRREPRPPGTRTDHPNTH